MAAFHYIAFIRDHPFWAVTKKQKRDLPLSSLIRPRHSTVDQALVKIGDFGDVALGGEFGGNVAYRTTADAGSSGHFEVSLLPGTYQVVAVPGGAPTPGPLE